VKYQFSPLERGGELVGEFYRIHSRCDFDGVGPRMGIQGTWFLGYGFRFLNEVSAALLYSHYDIREKEKASPGASTNNVNVRIKANKHNFTPVMQLFGGLAWGRYIYEEKAYLTLKFGYEVLYFWRSNQNLTSDNFSFTPNPPFFIRLEYKRLAEDVTFYGINIQAQLNF
jgi:hypothetical protein